MSTKAKTVEDYIEAARSDLSEGRYDSVPTNAQTAIETLLNSIIETHNLTQTTDIEKNYTTVRQHLGLDASDGSIAQEIKGMITHTIKILKTITEARNKGSTSHSPEQQINYGQANFILEQTISFINYIISEDTRKKIK